MEKKGPEGGWQDTWDEPGQCGEKEYRKMCKTELVMKSINRRASTVSLFVALLLVLAGCAASGPPSVPPDFSLPPRPRMDHPMPGRPPLVPGDVLAGIIEGETGPRVCFRPGKWREILSYLTGLEVYGRSESIRLEAHIEKLENRMKKIYRTLKSRK